MYTKTTSKSALFLMELILAIFFFSLASAVCIQLFVKAHLIGVSTTNKNHGILWAQNIAETYTGTDADFDATVSALNAIPVSDQSFCLYFDSDWNPASSENAAFIASVSTESIDNMSTAKITLTDASNDIIYQLSVSKHQPLKS